MMLTCSTIAAIEAARKQAWINYVKIKHAEDKNLVGTGSVEYDSLGALSDDEIAALKIYGLKDNVIQKTSGLTTQYTAAQKAYNLEKWYIPKPSVELMNGIVDYTEEEFDLLWLDPEL